MKKYNNKPNICGKLIEKHRLKKHYTKTKLCEKLELLGVNFTRDEIYKIEKQKMSLKDFELIAFCIVLEIEINEILSLLE